jgi:hypothetical protein
MREEKPRWNPHVTKAVPNNNIVEPVISGHLSLRVQVMRNPVRAPVRDDILKMIVSLKPVVDGVSNITARKKRGALKRMALVMLVKKKLNNSMLRWGGLKTRSRGIIGSA